MKVIAHRGMWLNAEDKNSFFALERALDNGFGFETDIRDYNGKLVISHNVAAESCKEFEDILSYYQKSKCDFQLALNVKADGIQELLEPLLEKYKVKNYFLFDMSIPELVVNDKKGLIYYTRLSDIESVPVMYEQAKGVWLDSFYDDNWFSVEIVKEQINRGKPVCIVSPELHGKDYTYMWELLKETGIYKSDLVTLCTDVPQKAKEYFEL